MTDRELFAQALKDALAKRYNDELAFCHESSRCSDEHYKKMSEILGFTVSPPPKELSFRKKMIIAMLAAALLLAGCTAVIFGNEIKTMLEQVFDTFIIATYDGERVAEDAIIEEYYVPTYIPEGYRLVEKYVCLMGTKYKYVNDLNDVLVYEQRLVCGTGYRFNNELGTTLLFNFKGKEIYHRLSSEYHNYIWNDGGYVFKLTLNKRLSDSELKEIIKGIIT